MVAKIKSAFTWVQANYMACFFAIFVGIVMLAPQIIFIIESGDLYQGIYILESDAEVHYLARIKEFVDGNGPGNPYIYDFKNNVPTTFFTYSEWILALPSIALGVSVPNMNLIYKFILPALLSLIIYWFLIRLEFKKGYALAGVSMIMFGNAMFYPESLSAFLRLDPIFTQFSLFARPVNPELSSIFFFVYLHILLSSLQQKSWKWIIALGILFGTTFYIYFYTFTFLIALNVTFIGILSISKQYSQALKISTATFIGFLIGVPVINELIQLNSHPYFIELSRALSVTNSRLPVIGITHIILYIIFLIYFKKTEKTPQLYLLLAVFTAGFVATNQQIITGRVMHEGHYLWYFISPIVCVIFLTIIQAFLKKRWKIISNTLIFSLIITPILFSIFTQYSSYKYWVKEYQSHQVYGPILAWINENTPQESVIMANDALSNLIPIYTGANVVWQRYADTYLMEFNRLYLNPERLLENDLISDYRLDYLIWDKEINADWTIPKSGLDLLFKNDRFEIYSIANK